MPKVILALVAHPDDAEFLCAGAMIRLGREHGWALHVATMTPGDCGSAVHPPDEIARIRRAEGAAAAAKYGASYRCVEERDLLVAYTPESLARTVRVLRETRPDVVITHSPHDYHLDHEMTSLVARAATFAAPVPNFLYHEPLKPLERIPHLYYCDPLEGKDQFGQPVPPGFSIDVSKVIETKAEALAAHASQREWLMKHHGVDEFVGSMREWCATRGKACGVAFAEGFRQHLGHSYPQDNVLGALLGTV
jgi:LmbE family N-acetylglucosaminyl deacetylase